MVVKSMKGLSQRFMCKETNQECITVRIVSNQVKRRRLRMQIRQKRALHQSWEADKAERKRKREAARKAGA